MSGPEDSEEEEEDEEEAPASRWQGIESIFEAYQEYVEGNTDVLSTTQTSRVLYCHYTYSFGWCTV